ncbi:SPOSA6832_02016, partial [Sporobolomyces salmonicolor]
MSGFFTLAAGACVGVESFTAGKLISVVLRCALCSSARLLAPSLTSSPDLQHRRRRSGLPNRLEALPSHLRPDQPPLLFLPPRLLLPPPRRLPRPPLGRRLRRLRPPSQSPHPLRSARVHDALLWLGRALEYPAAVADGRPARLGRGRDVRAAKGEGAVGEPPHQRLHYLRSSRSLSLSPPDDSALVLSSSCPTHLQIAFWQVSDALYLRAMLLTSPLAVTLGLSLTIPLAMLGDLYRSAPVSLASLIGGALVLGSFVANGVLDLKEAEKETVDKAVAAAVGERERLLEEGGSRRTSEER